MGNGGGLAYDPRVAHVGDVLHDAGHLAILPARVRACLGVGSVFAPAVRAERAAIARELDAAAAADEDHPLYWILRDIDTEETAAAAWALAACDAARVDARLVFEQVTFFKRGHVGPVANAGRELVADLRSGAMRVRGGLLELVEIGLMGQLADYPRMSRWLA